MTVKVVLLDNVDRVGNAGEVVDVSDGFSRNFLFPQKKALLATPGALKQYEERKRAILKQQTQVKTDAEDLGKKIEGLKLEIKANVGDEGKLFGAITTQDIHDSLVKNGFDIPKKKIEIDAAFKEVGEYEVRVRLHPEVVVSLKIVIS